MNGRSGKKRRRRMGSVSFSQPAGSLRRLFCTTVELNRHKAKG
jgi:hypothetical protein